MGLLSGMFRKKQNTEMTSARERDKLREAELSKQTKEKSKDKKPEKKIKRTTFDTMPYVRFVSNYIMLLKENVRDGKEVYNLYSKTYSIEDVNYSALTEKQQLALMQSYVQMLNVFNSTASLQLSFVNTKINRVDFKNRLMLAHTDDEYNEMRDEFNSVLEQKIMDGQNGLQCRKYITVTVAAIDFDAANSAIHAIETQLISCLANIGTAPVALNANERVRLMADILCDVNKEIAPCSQSEMSRQAEKYLCCPDYFEFKKDYFLFNDKYARCVYFKRFGTSINDDIYKRLIELNQTMVISQNVDFVESDAAIELVQRKLTDMHQEEISKVRKSTEATNGTFINTMQGSDLQRDQEEALQLLEDLRGNNEKMTLCQFIVMLTADSYEELQNNTQELEAVLRGMHIEISKAPKRQEKGFASVLPIGNCTSIDKEHNLQVRRTLSTSSTAAFMPFNTRELLHEHGLYYGQNIMTKNIILFDKTLLKNPNTFIFGVPGSGKSMTAKLEMLYSILSTNDEILVVDPEREYLALAELLGGEVIYISENSQTHINPLDLTENPDPKDKEYDPIKAKLDFLLSFFSAILGDEEISPIQKTIIDSVMHETYRRYSATTPTLKEYYAVLEEFENKASDEMKAATAFLRQALYLYVHGSMNVFSHESNVNIHKRIVVYDTKNLGKNMATLGMMIVLENIWNRLAHNRTRGIQTRIYIDEMYLMFKSEQSANFFYELWKRARKWGGFPTGITQNVDDVLRSDIARTMVSNTQFVVMLSLNTTDREQLAHLLKIAPDTMKYVTSAAQGCGLLHAEEYGTIPFDNTFPSNTNIYKIITTKFSEQITAAV